MVTELAELREKYLPEYHRPYRPSRGGCGVGTRPHSHNSVVGRELRHLQMFRRRSRISRRAGPKPYPSHSTGRVLTMEFLEGVPFDRRKVDEGRTREFPRARSPRAKASLDMIFRDGTFHADPHPGNMLLIPPTSECPAEAIGLLDVGMVSGVDDRLHRPHRSRDTARLQEGSRTDRGDDRASGRRLRQLEQRRAGRRSHGATRLLPRDAAEQFQLGTAP